MDKVTILSEQEFVLMAATYGMKKIYGFPIGSQPTSREDAVYVLQELVQKGFLEGQDKFVLTPDARKIFRIIDESESVLEVHKKSGRRCLIYLEEVCVKLTMSMRRKNCYEITLIPFAEVWRNLQEEGWIMEGKT